MATTSLALTATLGTPPFPLRPVPEPTDALGERIAALAARLHAGTFELLVLLREFDGRTGWNGGFASCAHWLHWLTGIALGAAREKVRVAHALATLPTISATMARGAISYAKVRALTRVATPENEAALLDFAQAGTAARWCCTWTRHPVWPQEKVCQQRWRSTTARWTFPRRRRDACPATQRWCRCATAPPARSSASGAGHGRCRPRFGGRSTRVTGVAAFPAARPAGAMPITSCPPPQRANHARRGPRLDRRRRHQSGQPRPAVPSPSSGRARRRVRTVFLARRDGDLPEPQRRGAGSGPGATSVPHRPRGQFARAL